MWLRLKEAWITGGGGSVPGGPGGPDVQNQHPPGQYNNPYLDQSQVQAQASTINSFTQVEFVEFIGLINVTNK